MSQGNSNNPAKGRAFQELAARVLEDHFSTPFHLDVPIAIGLPRKDHRFDLVSSDKRHIGECKNYSWTASGNVPSAKMGFCNEAAFYLSFLTGDVTRFITMRKDVHPKRQETLADYYYRTNKHLLGDVLLIEIDVTNEVIRTISMV